MKECCQCGRRANSGFVTYCDECFDSNEEVYEAVTLESYQKLELENQKLKQEIEQLKNALSDKSDYRVFGNLI